MKRSLVAKCPLCLQERKIIKSHIIPEFFLEAARDPKGRFLALQPARSSAHLAQQAFAQPLLCRECDNYLNETYEQPFLQLWYRDRRAPTVAFGPVYRLALTDYATFKLCLLSILWRGGVAAKWPFERVNLDGHEPALRDMLLRRDTGAAGDYPVFGAVVLIPDSLQVANVVSAPIQTSWEAARGYMFIFGGVAWHFLLRTGELPVDARGWALMEDGKSALPVIQLSDLKSFHRPFAKYAAQAVQKGWRNPWEKRQ